MAEQGGTGDSPAADVGGSDSDERRRRKGCHVNSRTVGSVSAEPVELLFSLFSALPRHLELPFE